MKAVNVSATDAKGDQAFFATLLPFLQSMTPAYRLKFRMKLTNLVLKYTYPEAYADEREDNGKHLMILFDFF